MKTAKMLVTSQTWHFLAAEMDNFYHNDNCPTSLPLLYSKLIALIEKLERKFLPFSSGTCIKM